MEIKNIVHVLYYGYYNILFDSSDEEDSKEKIWRFCEETVPRFSDKQFQQSFRMSPTTFEKLAQLVHSLEVNYVHSGQPEVTLEKQLMITIWCLANVESFRSVAIKFGVTKSTCWAVLYRMSKKILNVSQHYGIIAWPTGHRAFEVRQGFEEISQFPGVIGAIDGCHIQINKPKEHPNSYINRKGYPSVLLQGVCDNKKLFTDVFAGVPGSVHDSRLYRMSDLWQRIEHNSIDFPNDSHIIGDLAYILSTKLIVGFKNNGNLTNAQRHFNLKLSRARVIIEHAYAYLKGRFRRLKMLETVRLDLISLLIVTACILHNICIMQDDLPQEYVDLNNEEMVEVIQEEENEQMGNNLARNKRNTIMLQLEANF